jgi:hypothetical protein
LPTADVLLNDVVASDNKIVLVCNFQDKHSKIIIILLMHTHNNISPRKRQMFDFEPKYYAAKLITNRSSHAPWRDVFSIIT